MRPDHELQTLSSHLLYDVQVLFGASAELQRHTTEPGYELSWISQMALIESFALHARGLIEFLFRERGDRGVRKSDALAADYFDPGRWNSLRPPAEVTLDRVPEQAGQQIAHVTYHRVTLTAEAKQWPFAQIVGAIGRPLRVFVDNVPEDRVIKGFRAKVRDAFPDYLRLPVAISYPPTDWPPPTATRMADPVEVVDLGDP